MGGAGTIDARARGRGASDGDDGSAARGGGTDGVDEADGGVEGGGGVGSGASAIGLVVARARPGIVRA
jgi:hypothetical protein